MSLKQPRLRMFAGPNGSGKSTLKDVIRKELLGIYINPDDIEKNIRHFDFLDLGDFEISAEKNEILAFFKQSTLLRKADLLDEAEMLRFNDNKLSFFDVSVNAYFASVCASFIRKKLLEKQKSFTFETVMSAVDKVELLKLAQTLGYKTYLYYIATNDPIINVSRVKLRVSQGGHDVPEDKIISRYTRSLDKLWCAIQSSDRAYIFDNSGHSHTWLAEITAAKKLEIKQDHVPQWFQRYVIEAFEKVPGE